MLLEVTFSMMDRIDFWSSAKIGGFSLLKKSFSPARSTWQKPHSLQSGGKVFYGTAEIRFVTSQHLISGI